MGLFLPVLHPQGEQNPAEMMERVAEGKVWQSGLVAGIGEQFPQAAAEVSTELFGLLLDSTKGEYLQVAKGWRTAFEAWRKFIHRRAPSERASGPSRQTRSP